jgi:hypothetical protein
MSQGAQTMSARRRGLSLVAILLVGVVGTGAGVRRYHVQPQPLCGIPARDYQPPQPPPGPPPIVLLSKIAVPLVDTDPATLAGTPAMSLQIPGAAGTTRPRIKLFQFDPSAAAIDHCAISQMALTINENGWWRLNLRADQNPQTASPTTPAAPAATPANGAPPPVNAPIRGLPNVSLKQTLHIKRNLFIINIRGLGGFSEAVSVPPVPSTLGKPVLLALEPIQFWVQNGVPYWLVTQGCCPDASVFFNQIDRVELEFSYR